MGISDRVEEELSRLWDSGQDWILIFDNLLKHPGGKASKGCKCDMCEMQKLQHNHNSTTHHNTSASATLPHHGSYRWIIILKKCGHPDLNVFYLK